VGSKQDVLYCVVSKPKQYPYQKTRMFYTMLSASQNNLRIKGQSLDVGQLGCFVRLQRSYGSFIYIFFFVLGIRPKARDTCFRAKCLHCNLCEYASYSFLFLDVLLLYLMIFFLFFLCIPRIRLMPSVISPSSFAWSSCVCMSF